MTMKDGLEVGRIALRQEGNLWVAYYAKPNTMKDALMIATINMKLVAGNTEVKAAFVNMVQTAVSFMLTEVTGQTPSWNDPVVAPESERSKS